MPPRARAILVTRVDPTAHRDDAVLPAAAARSLDLKPRRRLLDPTLRSYFAYLLEVGWTRLLAALALMVLFSLTEGLGLALLLPTLQVAGLNLSNQGQAGRYAQMVTQAFAAVGLHPGLLMLLGFFVVLVGARALLGRAQNVATFAVVATVEDSLRRRLYRAIVNSSWSFVCRSRASDFTHALTGELERVATGTFQLMLLMGELVISLVYLVIAFELSAGMTILVLLCGLGLAFVFRGTIHEIEESGQELSDRTKTLYAATLDHLQGLKAAKAYGADQRNAEIFSALSSSVARANLESARRQAAASSWFELGSVLILAVVLYVSIRVLKVPSAEILILLLLFARVMPRFLSAHNHQRGFVNALPSFANVLSLEHRCLAAAEPPASAHPRLPLRRDISFAQVSFSYQPGAPPALHHLDLVIPAGKIVALVGPSGAGKSSVADLMMGLLVPDSGSVAIDGAALGVELARAWREQVGFVAADTFLFHDTIRENLRWASPAASEPEMRAALELAAAEFVFALPGGLETMVGDRGILLSQGERQRLALARAFLRRPSMLILDEATNSLDSENETRVFGAIERLRGEMTVLLIAHRLSTIRWAELIYVIEEGTIVESGDWSALSAKRDGRFRALWEAQSLAL